MHHLTLKDPVVFTPSYVIPAGDYITEDLSGAQLVTHAGGGTMKPLEEERPFDESKDWNGKRILFVRIGGFGDLTLGVTPTAREIKRRWPTCFIGVATMKHYQQVLLNLPFIDAILSDPVPKVDMLSYDAWIILENAVERNPRAKKLHMTDLVAEIAGLKGTVRDMSLLGKGEPALADKKPAYVVSQNESIWVMEAYPREVGKRRICIQVGTSAHCRTYPTAKMGEVAAMLTKKGWEVFLMGQKGEVKIQETETLRNLAAAGLTFRQSCAVINNADVFLGADSALLHIAGALDIPAVGLYGPFPGELRTKYCPKTVVMSGSARCAPCFHHAVPTRRNYFPDNCPSRARGLCEVLESIKPEAIVERLEKIAKKFELKLVT